MRIDADGKSYEATSLHAFGSPENPMSDAALEDEIPGERRACARCGAGGKWCSSCAISKRFPTSGLQRSAHERGSGKDSTVAQVGQTRLACIVAGNAAHKPARISARAADRAWPPGRGNGSGHSL